MRERTKLSGVAVALLAALAAQPAAAQEKGVKIGVLGDQSSAYSDAGGKGAVVAAEMAVEDFGKTVLGKPVEIVSSDHQNRPEIGANIARRWYDREGVDMI
ncbi:MAG TPA: ABC transporter substrate-binding protein, partial [Stellaceae bacterium]